MKLKIIILAAIILPLSWFFLTLFSIPKDLVERDTYFYNSYALESISFWNKKILSSLYFDDLKQYIWWTHRDTTKETINKVNKIIQLDPSNNSAKVLALRNIFSYNSDFNKTNDNYTDIKQTVNSFEQINCWTWNFCWNTELAGLIWYYYNMTWDHSKASYFYQKVVDIDTSNFWWNKKILLYSMVSEWKRMEATQRSFEYAIQNKEIYKNCIIEGQKALNSLKVNIYNPNVLSWSINYYQSHIWNKSDTIYQDLDILDYSNSCDNFTNIGLNILNTKL